MSAVYYPVLVLPQNIPPDSASLISVAKIYHPPSLDPHLPFPSRSVLSSLLSRKSYALIQIYLFQGKHRASNLLAAPSLLSTSCHSVILTLNCVTLRPVEPNRFEMDSFREILTPARVAAAVTAVGCAYMAYRVYGAKSYMDRCRSSAKPLKGLKCDTWTAAPSSWYRVNDVIMGGRSSSEVTADRQGRLVFSGTISTIGGGFASMRTSDDCKVRTRVA